MQRICKYCGKEYGGGPGSSACPDCVAKHKQSTLRARQCRSCGVTFQGGPRAWYCPDCRYERNLVRDREHKRNGPQRLLGSMDKCVICGGEYIVSGGLQRYCPSCAPEAVREIDRAQARQWQADNMTPQERKDTRKAATASIPCVICGKLFAPTAAAKTCSPECRAILSKRNTAQWERTHKEQRNEYRRNRRKEDKND